MFDEPDGVDGSKSARARKQSSVDVHVGDRIRLRRIIMGMSQERLGDRLGLSFQQIQKYERGVNRVTAARLFDLSGALDVPIGYFFDGMSEPNSSNAGWHLSSSGQTRLQNIVKLLEDTEKNLYPKIGKRETFDLARGYSGITDPSIRKQLLKLLRSLAPHDDQKPKEDVSPDYSSGLAGTVQAVDRE